MRALHRLLPLLVLLVGSQPRVEAAEALVQVHDRSGHPVADAVVSLTADPAPAPAPHPAATEKIIDQRNETFIPYVEIFRPGDRVVFRNSDRTRHHVYSFSRIKTFEFVLKPGESSPAMTLDQPGIAAIGCNIHDHMISYLFVTDALRAARTGPDGTVKFGDLAGGHYTVHVWHPQLHPGHPEMTQPLDLSDAAASPPLDFRLSLLPDPRMQMQGDEYGE